MTAIRLRRPRRVLQTLRTLVAASAAVAASATPADASQLRSLPHSLTPVVTYSFADASADVSESVGEFPLTITRDSALLPGVICYGVTNVGSEAGNTFAPVPDTQVQFPAGVSSQTVDVKIVDQGINGPSRLARAFMHSCGGNTKVATPNQTLTLLQDDPLAARDPANPLGYPQAPTDGDPLQHVSWYVFGTGSAAGAAAAKLQASSPAQAAKLNVIANSPGSLSFRFWMWNEPASSLAATVEKYLADAQVAQPGTTIQLSTYSLVHGRCENPNAIKGRYEQWISQLARGIGNFRVVLYLEEDSLIEMRCLTPAERKVRLAELAYAVRALSADPHLLIYLDAGAPDASVTPAQDARWLRAADVAQAQGFAVNSTHRDWSTADISYGQQIARRLGGKHFIINTSENGRGPKLNPHPKTQGVEQLCNPPSRGLGPLSWNTGYKYLDGMLWYNNPGNSEGTCGKGDPATAVFWPAYALGLVSRRVDRVTGPHYRLVRSSTDE